MAKGLRPRGRPFKRIYRPAAETREEIVKVATDLSRRGHYRDVQQRDIAQVMHISSSNVHAAAGTMEELKTMVIDYAIKTDDKIVIAQAIVDRHPAASHLTNDQKLEIFKSFLV